MVFNGSCSSICTWKSTNLSGPFQFRAVAANNIGFGEYSGISEDIMLVEGILTYLCTSLLHKRLVAMIDVVLILATDIVAE